MAFEAKWFIVEALPIMLAVSIVIVVAGVRVLQVIQRVVCRRLPFGATSDTSLTDVVIGIFITGLFYLYFRTWHHVVGRHPGTSGTQPLALVGHRLPICDGFSLPCETWMR